MFRFFKTVCWVTLLLALLIVPMACVCGEAQASPVAVPSRLSPPVKTVVTNLVLFVPGGGFAGHNPPLPVVAELALHGWTLEVVDYPVWPEAMLAEQVAAVHDAVVDARTRYPGARITLIGHSAGGYLAMMADAEPDALVALASPVDLWRWARASVYPQTLPRIVDIAGGSTDLNVVPVLNRDVPTVAVFGTDDDIVPLEEGATLPDWVSIVVVDGAHDLDGLGVSALISLLHGTEQQGPC